MHRWFGVQLNNEAWDLLEQIGPHSPLADRDRPLAAEVMTRALAATGDGPAARRYWQQARELTAQVKEEGDRRAIVEQMATEPDWPSAPVPARAAAGEPAR